ncbi:hypothetical protein M0813_19201 [Anaeramoeba flamelloides]|uniref:Uncharacterized protein n=1 Tax=Anaeramoeba flamelloides TaxID=1746091 RepID=A0ABQ8YPK7_9EUKA|nr:hypothetical protein M0813_19201 [Anaeramoeba flamelloides]
MSLIGQSTRSHRTKQTKGVKFSQIMEHLKQKVIEEDEQPVIKCIKVFVKDETLYYKDYEFTLYSCCYLEDNSYNGTVKSFGRLIKITPFEITISLTTLEQVRVLISQLAVGQYSLSQ